MSSLINVLRIVEGIPPWKLEIRKLKENKLFNSHMEENAWFRKLGFILSILNKIDIDYVLIKYLNVPFVYMQDIDLLVESLDDRKKLFRRLLNMGFVPLRSILPSHKEKVEFWLPSAGIQVDIYPAPLWWKIRFAPDYFITATKEKVRIGLYDTYVPNPTCDLLITITHSYAHATITLGELAHEAKLLITRRICWSSFIKLVEKYHLEHAAISHLILLRPLLSIARDYGMLPKNEAIHKNFESIVEITDRLISKSVLNRKVATTVLNEAKLSQFPITLPIGIRVFSSTHEIALSMLKKRCFQCNEFQTYLVQVVGHVKKEIKWTP